MLSPAPSTDSPSPANRGRWVLLAGTLAAVALFLALGPDEQTVIRRAGAWRVQVHEHLLAAVIVFFVTEVIIVGLSVPVGIWLTILAGFLFGPWVGTAVVVSAATIGAVLAFLSARYVFADALHRAARTRPKLGRMLARVDAGFRDHGAYYIVLLRLTPVVPFFVLNLGLGLTRVRLITYTWASLVGMAPITLVVVNAGASLAEVTSFRDVLSWRVLGALCLMPLVPFALHHTAGRWLARSSQPAARA